MSKEDTSEAALGKTYEAGRPLAERVEGEEAPFPGGSSQGAAELGARGTREGGMAGDDELERGEREEDRA